MKISMTMGLPRRLAPRAGGPIAADSASWAVIEEYLKGDDRVIIPVGSQEQHGRHMPLGVDWMIPQALGSLLSSATGVLCTSPVCYGISWLHSGFPGTVSLKPETLIAIYRDIVSDLYRQGFRRMLVLNGHGGNINALNLAFGSLVSELALLRIKMHQWWLIPEVQTLCSAHFGKIDSHAGPAETSVMLHLWPELVDMSVAVDNESPYLPFFPNPSLIRGLYADGVMQNDATRADAAVGRDIIETCLDFLKGELAVKEAGATW